MEGMVQIPFTYTDGTFNYSDALWLPADHSFTEEQIEAMKKERFDNWKAFILNPPPAPTDEELAEMGITRSSLPPEPENQTPAE